MKFKRRLKRFWKTLYNEGFMSYWEFTKEMNVLFGLMVKKRIKLDSPIMTGGTYPTPTKVHHYIEEYHWNLPFCQLNGKKDGK
ncbi:hypothetical protein LCGC14_1399520 [marine sediment metagenome]|uniref:Uncharacterized protein n=1 Tax=marine sediment metagenome TaxID=412755 RepID=A0A0F9MZ48_9ZZZZ